MCGSFVRVITDGVVGVAPRYHNLVKIVINWFGHFADINVITRSYHAHKTSRTFLTKLAYGDMRYVDAFTFKILMQKKIQFAR